MLPARLISPGALCAAMSFLFSIPTHAIIDSDGDRLSDIWELQYGLSTTWNDYESHNDDWDGDGWGLLKEAIAGTDPYSAAMPARLVAAEITQTATPGTFSVSWPTLAGKQYQLVVSPDLTENSWVPVGAPIVGEGTPIQIGIEADLEASDKLFWRVEISDVDSDLDGLSDFEEGLIGTNPQSSDTDGDGVSDAGEHGAGTSPTNPAETPTADWFELSGNSERSVEKVETRTYTIKKGQSRVLVVATASDEYPYYTEYESEFDDVISWQITPSTGSAITGSIHVNERHVDWLADEINGVKLTGNGPTYDPVHIERVKVLQAPIDSDLTVTVKLSATNVSDSALPSHVIVGLLPIRIEVNPEDIGVLGDNIPSNKGEGGQKHFVTPKETTEIAESRVWLKAHGLKENWITKDDPNQLVEWVSGVGEAYLQPEWWKVKRDTPGKYPVTIRTLQKYGGEEAAKLNVWVVWTTISPSPATYQFYSSGSGATYGLPDENDMYQFKFKINPESIVDIESDIPSLNGISMKDVPGKGKSHAVNTAADGDSAPNKWDLSRKMKVTILNPGGILRGDLDTPIAFYTNQPSTSSDPIKSTDSPIDFPSNAVEGNDDSRSDDEDGNPYRAVTSGQLQHAVGWLSSIDRPNMTALNSWGVNQREFGIKLDFKEFARLELWDGSRATGNFWYRISAPHEWHYYFLTKFNGSTNQWENNGSSIGAGN